MVGDWVEQQVVVYKVCEGKKYVYGRAQKQMKRSERTRF
jgi:hypothetical protein